MKTNHPIRIKKSTDGQWYFVLIAANGQTLVTSEMYKTKRSAVNAADAVAAIFTAQHPTADQLVEYLLNEDTDPTGLTNRQYAETIAHKFLNTFKTVRDQLHQFIKVEK